MDSFKLIIEGNLHIVQVINLNSNENKEISLLQALEIYYKCNSIKIREIFVKTKEQFSFTIFKIICMLCQKDTKIHFEDNETITIQNYIKNSPFLKLNDNDYSVDCKMLELCENEFFELYILIPFRARGQNLFREEQFKRFKDHMTKYFEPLQSQNPLISYKFIIIEQENDFPFNRGILLNIGFLECEKLITPKIKYYVHHNCDLFPDFGKIDYSYTSPYDIRDLFGFNGGLGGICIMNRNTFKKINGFPNNYFGWGGEDTCVKNRSTNNNININRESYNQNIIEENKLQKNTGEFNSINTQKNNNDIQELNGLTTCKYNIINTIHSKDTIIYKVDFDYNV
jgi:hypothetical protein